MKTHPSITSDPKVMTGVPCLKGTRVTVANIVHQISAGRSIKDICEDYPYLNENSIKAALNFVADRMNEETHDLLAS